MAGRLSSRNRGTKLEKSTSDNPLLHIQIFGGLEDCRIRSLHAFAAMSSFGHAHNYVRPTPAEPFASSGTVQYCSLFRESFCRSPSSAPNTRVRQVDVVVSEPTRVA